MRWVVSRWLRRSPIRKSRLTKTRKYVHYLRTVEDVFTQWTAAINDATIFKSYSTARKWAKALPMPNMLLDQIEDGEAGIEVRLLTKQEMRAYTGRVLAEGE